MAALQLMSGTTFDTRIHGVYSGASYAPIRTDQSTHSLQILPYSHQRIHAGSHYFTKDWYDVNGSGSTCSLLIQVADDDKLPHTFWEIVGEAEFTLTLYKDPTIKIVGGGSASGTALLRCNNRFQYQTVSPSLTLYYLNPEITTSGSTLYTAKIGSGKADGGGNRADREVVLEKDTKYLFVFVKEAAGIGYVDWHFEWYEHEDRS